MNILWFKKYIFSMVVACGIISLMQFYLVKIGELNIDNVTLQQKLAPVDKPILFSSGINQDLLHYKTSLIKEHNPQAIILGSSRAMQLLSAFFDVSIVNAGGSIRSIQDLSDFASKHGNLLNKQQHIFIMLDPWWFGDHAKHKKAKEQKDYPKYISIEHIMILSKHILLNQFLEKKRQTDNLGIHSILSGDGYAVDGSYQYTHLANGGLSKDDINFTGTYKRIRNSIYPFNKVEDVSLVNIRKACNAINQLTNSVGGVTIVVPPFAKPVWTVLDEKNTFGFFDTAERMLSHCTGLTIYNMQNPDKIHVDPKSTCEFIDGYHGGNTTYARILRMLADEDDVANLVNLPFLDAYIHANTGFATQLEANPSMKNLEIDFLKIGCNKTYAALSE